MPDAVVGATNDRRLFGLPVGYPIGVPASPLTATSGWIAACSGLGFNVLTYKTVRNGETPTPALPPPNWLFTEDLTEPLPPGAPIGPVRVDVARKTATGLGTYSMVNSCGIPSDVPAEWQRDIRRSLDALRPGQLLIVSVVGDYESLNGQALIDDFVEVASLAEAAGARIIELNLSCPNTVSSLGEGVRPPICESSESTHEIVAAVRGALHDDTNLVAKLGYLNREVLESVTLSIASLVQGVAGINTVQVDVEDGARGPVFLGTLRDPTEPRKRAGLSGVAIRDYALEFVRSLALLRRTHGWDFEIIGMGGIMDAHDVRALMASGADAVQTATAATNNPGLPKQLCNDGHALPSEEDRNLALLDAALSDERWEFRTIDGLARDLRLAPDRVLALIDRHPEIVRESAMTDKAGRALYVTGRHRPTLMERLERYRWILAH